METKFFTIIVEGNYNAAASIIKTFIELLGAFSVEVVYKDSPFVLTSGNYFKVYCIEKEEK